MYESHFGLSCKPFSLLPDPEFLFLSNKHDVALSMLEYAVCNDLVLSVVSGEVGAGKTTLVRRLLRQLGADVTVGLITNTHHDYKNLLQFVAMSFGLDYKGKEEVELFQIFTEFLEDEFVAGRRTLLIVDEAQNLDHKTLEEIRLLTNINADDRTYLQLMLVGQPELHDKLKQHELRQLAQRIGVVAQLEALSEKETASYVQHRVEVAGGDPRIFHKNALRLVYWNSGGIPRVINTLCDLALVYAFAERKKMIDAALIADIARDRIDTGLFGNFVFDTKDLERADASSKHLKSDQFDGDAALRTVSSPSAPASETEAVEPEIQVLKKNREHL
ncbi:MAG: AAA family ATPase, partial [Pseudomonadota bacterium]